MESLTIGQLANLAGVTVETIRYYERRELIPEPPRRESGYRQYSHDFVRRVQFIKRAQKLGFSLKEISKLLSLRVEAGSVCDEVKQQAEAKIADVDAKIQTLQRMKQSLAGLVTACQNNELTTECPILEALDVSDS